MPTLRLQLAKDILIIRNWPPYPPEFEELDYALRENGWIGEFHGKPEVCIYVAEHENEIVGFTVLAKTNPAEAEFRIAMRPDKIGTGLGKVITAMTMNKGFATGLSQISLVVRKNNQRAFRLYRHLGFCICGKCVKTVNGRPVSFLAMAAAKLPQPV